MICRCGHARSKHDFFSTHTHCYECKTDHDFQAVRADFFDDAPSQSSEQGAPERIWINPNSAIRNFDTGVSEGGFYFLDEQIDGTEYTRSDICASLVEALEQMLYIFDRELDEGTIGRNVCDAARAALSQVKTDDK